MVAVLLIAVSYKWFFWGVQIGSVLLAIFGLVWGVRWAIGHREGDDVHCKRCGYDVSMLWPDLEDGSKACPECGVVLASNTRVGIKKRSCWQGWAGLAVCLFAGMLFVSGNLYLRGRRSLPGKLQQAILACDVAEVDALLNQHPDLMSNAILPRYGVSLPWPVLHEAVKNGNASIVARVLQEGPSVNQLLDIQHPFFLYDTKTPLGLAIRRGDATIIELLLKAGADPNQPFGRVRDFLPNKTPLSLAVEGGDHVVVDLLLTHGADPNGFVDAIANGRMKHVSPLWLALHPAKSSTQMGKPSRPVVQVLLNHGAEIVAGSSGDPPVLHQLIVAGPVGTLESCQVMAQIGCDMAAEDSEGRNALHVLLDTYRGDIEQHFHQQMFRDLVGWFISQGLDPLAMDHQGRLPGEVSGNDSWTNSDLFVSEWYELVLCAMDADGDLAGIQRILERVPELSLWGVHVDDGTTGGKQTVSWLMYRATMQDRKVLIEALLQAGEKPLDPSQLPR